MAASQTQKPYFLSAPNAGTSIYSVPANGFAYLHKVRIVAGSAAATAQVYDNTSATGNPIAILGAATNYSDEIDFSGGLTIGKGLFVVLTGTGAQLMATVE